MIPSPQPTEGPSKGRRLLLRYTPLIFILLVAAGLRFYHIDRLPPGLHYDEAFSNLLALRWPDWDPFPPVFFEVEFGRCALYPTLIALLFQVTGPLVLGGRLVSAAIGTLTVGLTFFALREMFREQAGDRRAAAIGLAAALSLAVLYWHVHLSRIGMESITVPALLAAAFGALWRALRRRRTGDVLLAGVVLGLTPYTYPTALFVPPFLALFFGARALLERGFWPANWSVLLAVACIALLVVAPLIHFFATHPAWLTERSNQVVRPGLLEGIVKVLGGLFLQGDRNPRQNLPGRPILDPVQAALFLLGVGTCLVRRRPPHYFLLCWLGVMLLPSALTEYPPHAWRMSGAAPAVAGLTGLGAVSAVRLILTVGARARAGRRGSPQVRRTIAAALVALAFAFSTVRTARDYFLVWAQGDLFITFDVGLRWIGETVAGLPPGERVYVSPTDRFWKTLEFLLGGDPFRTHNYNGRRCVVYPAVTGTPTTHVIVVREDPNSLPALRAAFPTGRVVDRLAMDDDGTVPYAVVYRTPAGATAQVEPAHRLEANFEGRLHLRGYDLPEETFAPGETISLYLTWYAPDSMTDRYKVFVHLWGPSNSPDGGKIWGQEDVHPCDNSYYTPWWAAGEIVVDEYRVPIKPGAPAGEYRLLVGLYREDGPRLQVSDPQGEPVGDHLTVTTVRVTE